MAELYYLLTDGASFLFIEVKLFGAYAFLYYCCANPFSFEHVCFAGSTFQPVTTIQVQEVQSLHVHQGSYRNDGFNNTHTSSLVTTRCLFECVHFIAICTFSFHNSTHRSSNSKSSTTMVKHEASSAVENQGQGHDSLQKPKICISTANATQALPPTPTSCWRNSRLISGLSNALKCGPRERA